MASYPYIRALGAALLAVFVISPARAQSGAGPRLFADPPPLAASARSRPAIDGAIHAMTAIQAAPPGPRAHAGSEIYYDLSIKYVDGTLYDPKTKADQKVSLRSYADTGSGRSANPRFIAPLINAAPGDTVRISLHNDLPSEQGCPETGASADQPKCYNSTNLHSHGLWVSPTGNSDNVLLSIDPGVSFQYEYNIPADHPAGTFWYHPHRHGATAVQTGSGMAGALVIHGDRKPSPDVNGDLDTLLVTPAGKPYTERTLVFVQIPYACHFGADGKVKTDAQGTIDWTCAADETGKVEDINQFGPGKWAASGRWTTINGIVLPTFDQVQAGVPERWRLVDAGVVETLKVQFRKAVSSAALAPLQGALTRGGLPNVIDQACAGDIVPYQVVAADGLTMDRTLTKTVTTLQPGYRYDLMVVFPEPGNYCMIQPSTTASANADRVDAAETLLGFVKVGGTTKVPGGDVTKVLVDALVSSAKINMPAAVRDRIVSDLKYTVNGKPAPRLTSFVPHKTVTPEEISGVADQEMVFFLSARDPTAPNAKFEFTVGNSFRVVDDNGYLRPDGAREYDPGKVDRNLVLGQAQQWDLRSYSVSHPFHIHVNPFQIVSVIPVDAQGVDGPDLSLPGAVDSGDGDDQYAGLQGAWKDTLWVKTNLFPGNLTNPPVNYYKITVRTRYERYIGEFVLHCHILDHEDQGMMQNVMISIPDALGGASAGMAGMVHAHK
jgi:FtsP/CotA-like multicopper oxidase with cupredoxin domain